MIAIIGGTGVGSFELDEVPQTLSVDSAWGSALVQVGRLGGKEVAFLARHGSNHRIPPHRINFRANIAALAQLGVRAAIATTAVGSLRPDLSAGSLVLLDNFIDFTGSRAGKTFFDGQPGAPVVHTDFTHAYSEPIRTVICEAAAAAKIQLQSGGTYLCAEGPRYETTAEVRLFAAWGADVVGMTGVPETTLAREAGIHYAGVSLVTNLGAGLSPTPLTHAEVEDAMRAAMPRLCALIAEAVSRIDTTSLPPIGPGVGLPEFAVPS